MRVQGPEFRHFVSEPRTLSLYVFTVVLCASSCLSQQMSLPGAGQHQLTPSERTEAAAIMELSNKIEDATVRGDVAYVDSVLSPDFKMIHGSGWTMWGNVAADDDKAAYLQRVKNKEYVVHDMDPSSVHFEMHGDVAITWGRYLSLFMPANRNTANPGRLNSIWFERVYQKQNGKWIYLSHRSVRTAISPAGVDPGSVTTVMVLGPGQAEANGDTLVMDGTIVNAPRRAAQPASGTAPPRGNVAGAAAARAGGSVVEKDDTGPEAQEVTNVEKKVAAAIVAGDTAYYDAHTSDDFSMTHGDIWVRGGQPGLVDSKETFHNRVKFKQYLAFEIDHQAAEIHGNVAITHGRYLASLQSSNPDWFSCWYEKVYEKRNGEWVMLSHRTVHGAIHGPTRESVLDK
jgi:hypothetical protein